MKTKKPRGRPVDWIKRALVLRIAAIFPLAPVAAIAKIVGCSEPTAYKILKTEAP